MERLYHYRIMKRGPKTTADVLWTVTHFAIPRHERRCLHFPTELLLRSCNPAYHDGVAQSIHNRAVPNDTLFCPNIGARGPATDCPRRVSGLPETAAAGAGRLLH